MLATSLPYLLGFQTQGDNWSYTGFIIGVEDGNSYLAKMLSGASGNWLFKSSHSTMEQKGVLAYFPYILLGKFAGGPEKHFQLVSLYHAFRFIAGVFAILASYEFISIFIKSRGARWWALSLSILGGGLGWVLVTANQKDFLGSLPLDFISPESFGFLGLLGFPHLSAARALLLYGLVMFLTRENGYLAGTSWLLMGFFQPMVGIVAWIVIAGYLAALYVSERVPVIKKPDAERENIRRQFRKSAQAILISSPIVIYTTIVYFTDPYFIGWNLQNRFLSPHPLHYLVAYGVVIPFAIVGVKKLLNTAGKSGMLIIGWMICFPFMIYAPIVSQRRMAEGFWVCLVIAMVSLFDGSKIPVGMRVIWSALFTSTLFLLIGSTLQVLEPHQPLYRRVEEIHAMEALSGIVQNDQGVLSSFEVGNNLPARIPAKAVIGHGPETIGLADLLDKLNEFFRNTDLQEGCNSFFEEIGADFLFWGPEEEKLWMIDPAALDCTSEFYNQDGYRLYYIGQ